MTNKQIDCFKRNITFLWFLGFWPRENSPDYYKYYSKIFVTFIFILYDILVTTNFFFMPRQLDLFIEELLFYFTEIAALSKALTLLFMHEKIKDIFEMLECDIFQPDTNYTSKIIVKAAKFIKINYFINLVVSYTANLVHVFSPMIVHLLLPVELDLPTCSYSFIPENIKHMLIYPLYIYQSVGMHCVMLLNVNTDIILWGLMILTIAQLEVLDYNLRRITDYVVTKENDSEKEQVLKSKFHKCIQHFYEINRFCSLIEDVFSASLFVQFSASCCVICVSLFRFTLPAPNSYYIFLIAYATAMVIEIFIPCWFGTQIMVKSSSLSVAIYSCDWISRPRKFKQSMILFVERMNRPLSITGMKMFPLLLTTFTKIMNTAYSFYTFLRNMETEE